jgi:two-component system chemotaxis response regulator CheB
VQGCGGRRINIYVAPTDNHMLVTKEQVVVGKGAPENRWRPSINNLFRSAAAQFNSRVIGIILTGLLDDGTSGMASIKRAGGLTIVQDPDEADHPDMPLSVLDNVKVDFTESLTKMGVLLRELITTTEPNEVNVPQDIIDEANIDLRVSTRTDNLAKFKK